MSIRFKLILSNILMIIIPLIFSIVLAVFLIGINLEKSGLRQYNSDEITDSEVQQAFKELVSVLNDALNHPDKFEDLEYLKNIDNKLKSMNLGFCFAIDNNIYYLSDNIDRLKFQKHIILNADKNETEQENTFGSLGYINYKFELSDGKKGVIYVFFDKSPLEKFLAGFITDFLRCFLIIVLLTNGLLTLAVSSSIIRPLKKLKYGAEQIKEGNLSFVIDEKSSDEVGEVCRAFEEMRQRLKAALEQQIKYDEERNEFIASITHDLKTPITSIKCHIDGLRDGVANTPEKIDKYTDIIYKKVLDMDRLINDLTFYSNQNLKKIPFNFSKLNLKAFIEDMVDEYKFQLDKIGINMEYEYNLPDSTQVKADSEKLKRVFSNIIENSIKYMDKENGEIKIDVKDRQNKVLIGIHDNGEGIKQEYLPNIFNRFYRADPSRNTSKGGSGLGLAIARQIIEEHGGKIYAESKYGYGTSIYFELEKVGMENEKKDTDN
ncbi:HAMP domain-containing sensor histidine kinase [Acetivibrio clariflavus]|uniref:histidine kinase n=1 Tax=Acetivibrio clariflavus (strain DSM 19732 / NBRC 101661 / EBR45) TaxID=720554 RepID=G8LSB7_ACECE|nr:HAMP domain-containing sensor histidine kinase [Acetivibrio clariflavus]AEV67178.1 signal transduction histidine kinase [Acetivibrio clariflavus DSM 19732]